METDEVLLDAHGLEAGYGAAAPVFRELDLTVRRGEIVGVLGPTGRASPP